MSWDIDKRRAYLLRLGFDGAKVAAATDEWVVMMTSHLK